MIVILINLLSLNPNRFLNLLITNIVISGCELSFSDNDIGKQSPRTSSGERAMVIHALVKVVLISAPLSRLNIAPKMVQTTMILSGF